MLFEIRAAAANQCTEKLQPIATIFLDNKPVEAFRAFKTLNKAGEFWTGLNEFDWLFLSALFLNCGFIRKQAASHRLAVKHLKNPILIAAMHAWDLSYRGKYFDAKTNLEELSEFADETEMPLVIALQSYNYSTMGWDKTAAEFHEKAVTIASDDPMVWYVLSRASARRTDWGSSIQEATKASKLAPHWTRSRAGLSDSLMATGQNDAARQIIQVTNKDAKTCGPDYVRTLYSEVNGDTDQAISELSKFLTDWPIKNDYSSSAATKLTLLLMQQNKLAAAKRVISSYDLQQFEDLLKVADSKANEVASKYISMPLVSQTRNHCVPTVAAMVAGSQGYDAKPAEFAQGMCTRHGTQLWQMVDYMKSIGFAAICIKPEPETIVSLLDQDIPLIGQLKGLFMGHVDCVCGYDRHLELFHLRDPMHWQGSCIQFGNMTERYEGTSSLWAFVANERISQISVKPEWVNFEGIALTDLARAAANGRRKAAEQAFAKIAIDHPARFLANQHAHLVAMTESEFQAELKTRVDQFFEELKKEEPAINFTSVEAMLQFLNDDNADDMIRMVKNNSDQFSSFFVKYVEAQCLFAKSKWHEALEAYQELCFRSPSLDSLWTQLSEIQQQLGMHEEAQQSLDIAIEVSPESESLHRRKLGSQTSELRFEQRLQHAQDMMQEHPFSPATRLTLANVMQDSDDGLGYEKILLQCIKYYPRYAVAYNTLTSWYLGQSRDDKAKEILLAARQLMGDEEMPLWDFELTEQQNEDPDQNEQLQSEASQSEDETESKDPGENDYRSRFQRLWTKVVADFDKSKQELEFGDDFKQLALLDADRKIHWWESARFLSMRYANLMADQSPRYTKQPGQKAKDLQELLPAEMPGIAEAYVKTVLESIDMPSSPHDCLVVLLQWVNAKTPRREKFPDLQFLRAYLMEQLDRLNESELVLRQIVSDFPANQAALYRLAQIAEQQADLNAAEEFYHKCIEVSPGHYGSSEALIRLAGRTGKPTVELEKRLLQTFPYNASYVYNVAISLTKEQSVPAADQFYLDHESNMPQDRFHSLRARMLFESGRQEDAIEYLDKNEPNNDGKLDYISSWVRIDFLVQQEQYEPAIELLEKMGAQCPHDTELIDQLIRLKRELNMLDAKLYARKKLSEGCPVFVVCYVFLQDEKNPAEMAIEILNQVPIDCRDNVAEQMVEAIQQTSEHGEQLILMRFCHERLPHLHRIRHVLANTLQVCGLNEEAVQVAKALLDEQPNNPHWLELIGSCYQGYDNEKCLEYLGKAFEITGRADTLVQIGRNQSEASQQDSEKTFWEVLNLDPYNTVAMTNLFWVHNVRSPKLWSFIEPALNAKGAANIQCEYFLITAKIVAEYLKQPVSIEWFYAAVTRAKDITQHGGFGDEPERLGVSLMQWWSCWRSDEHALATGQDISRAGNEKWIPIRPDGFILEQTVCMQEEDMESMFDYLTKMRSQDPEVRDREFPERIASEIDELELAMQSGRWKDAKIFANRAISKFDETVGNDDRLMVVQRLIDAENNGGLFDRINLKIPANLTAYQVVQIMGCGLVAIGLAAYLAFQFWLELSPQIALLASVTPLMILTSGYFARMHMRASSRLKAIEQTTEIETASQYQADKVDEVDEEPQLDEPSETNEFSVEAGDELVV